MIGAEGVARLGTLGMLILEGGEPLAKALFDSGMATGGQLLASLGLLLAPVALMPLVALGLAMWVFRLFVPVGSKIAPKLSRISPLQGLRNKFGVNGLYEFGKSTAKLVVVSLVLGAYLAAQTDLILSSLGFEARPSAALIVEMLAEFVLLVLLCYPAIGALDYLWQVDQHRRKHRMSRKELMDELKQSEGDPHLKAQRRQRGEAIARNSMLREVPGADVVIVNPTHYAVALKWNRKGRRAPVCVAKGVDEMAARIREIAIENGVPLHSSPATARALHALVDLGEEVPPDTYAAVAASIRFADAMRGKARARRAWGRR